MNKTERKILIQWARDEDDFLNEVISRCKLHKKILKERVNKILGDKK